MSTATSPNKIGNTQEARQDIGAPSQKEESAPIGIVTEPSAPANANPLKCIVLAGIALVFVGIVLIVVLWSTGVFEATPEAPESQAPPVAFEAATVEFDALHTGEAWVLASHDSLRLLKNAGVWMPHTQEWLITSDRMITGATSAVGEAEFQEQFVQISALHYKSGKVRRLQHLETEGVVMANGGTTDFNGNAFLVSQGYGDESGSIWFIDKYLESATRLGPPQTKEVVLTSPNDIVYHPEKKTLLVTDPVYSLGFFQNFRTTFSNKRGIWAFSLEEDGESRRGKDWRIVANQDGELTAPNGILFSSDFATVYVGDLWSPRFVRSQSSGSCSSTSSKAERAMCGIEEWWQAYKTETSNTYVPSKDDEEFWSNFKDAQKNGAQGRIVKYRVDDLDLALKLGSSAPPKATLFSDLQADTDGRVFPDGLKADAKGHVYVGGSDGIRVFDSDGYFLGLFRINGGVANLAFGGPNGDLLLALNGKRAICIQMKVVGALGPYRM